MDGVASASSRRYLDSTTPQGPDAPQRRVTERRSSARSPGDLETAHVADLGGAGFTVAIERRRPARVGQHAAARVPEAWRAGDNDVDAVQVAIGTHAGTHLG